MPVSVYFHGLICHVWAGASTIRKKFAVVVNAPGHDAKLFYDGGQKHKQLTNGIQLDFGDLGRDFATAGGLFNPLVPNLANDDLAIGTLKSDVDDATNVEDVHAYVHFPPGSRLLASRAYEQQCAHVRNARLVRVGCVARLIRLEIPVESELQVKPFEDVVLSPSSPGYIRNTGSATASNKVGPTHTRHYSRILYNGQVADSLDLRAECDDPIIETDVPGWVLTHLRTEEPESLRVECANSQWP
jgi:hypothetical protein